MGKPVFFEKVGKAIKDVLSQDYSFKNQVKISSSGSDGSKLQSSATQKGDSVTIDGAATVEVAPGTTVQTKVDSASKVSVKIEAADVVGADKVIVDTSVPGVSSGDVELQKVMGNLAVSTKVGLQLAPKVSVSATHNALVDGLIVGAEAGYDASKGQVSKYGVLLNYKSGDVTAQLIGTDKLDTIKASVLHDYSSSFSYAAELVKKMSKNETTMTLGSNYKISGSTTFKAKVDNNGTITTMYKFEVAKGTTFAASAELNSFNLEKFPKMGFTVTLK